MPDVETSLFEVRAERIDDAARRWAWAIYRTGARTPSRRSRPIFLTDADAIDAGGQVIADLRRRASHSSFVRPSH